MITWPITITQHASLWVHTPGECAREATEEDLAAAGFVPIHTFEEVQMARRVANERIAGLEAEATSPAHRQAIDDLCIARAERDEARDRCIRAARILIAEFGADGPLNVDEAAERAVRVHRDTVETAAEQERDAVVDRICEAVRYATRTVAPRADDVLIGRAMVTSHGNGEAMVDRIRAEIRKAAGGSYDE